MKRLPLLHRKVSNCKVIKIVGIYFRGSVSGQSLSSAIAIPCDSDHSWLSACLILEWIAHRNAIFDLAWLSESDLVSMYIWSHAICWKGVDSCCLCHVTVRWLLQETCLSYPGTAVRDSAPTFSGQHTKPPSSPLTPPPSSPVRDYGTIDILYKYSLW